MSLSALAIAKGGIRYGALQVAALGFLAGGQPPIPPIHGDSALVPWHTQYKFQRSEVKREVEAGIPATVANQRLTPDILFPKAEFSGKLQELAGKEAGKREQPSQIDAQQAVVAKGKEDAKGAAEDRQRLDMARQREDELVLMLMAEFLD